MDESIDYTARKTPRDMGVRFRCMQKVQQRRISLGSLSERICRT